MAELEDFKDDCGERDAKIAELQKQIEDLKDERARLERELAEKREAQPEPKPVAQPMPVVQKYRAQKGDAVDELMAHWINQYNLDVPLVRLDDKATGEYRRYMFGTKKIQAKILNEKLVVKVGGGYMLINEFIETYG